MNIIEYFGEMWSSPVRPQEISPPIPDPDQMAKILEKKTREIDRLKERLIEKDKEFRKLELKSFRQSTAITQLQIQLQALGCQDIAPPTPVKECPQCFGTLAFAPPDLACLNMFN